MNDMWLKNTDRNTDRQSACNVASVYDLSAKPRSKHNKLNGFTLSSGFERAQFGISKYNWLDACGGGIIHE